MTEFRSFKRWISTDTGAFPDIADDAWTDITSDIVGDDTSWQFLADPVHLPSEFRCSHCDTRVVNPDGDTWIHAGTGNQLCDVDRVRWHLHGSESQP